MSDGDPATLVEELRDAIRARDDFLAIAAHELRNPMHALLLSVTTTLNAARRHGDPDLIERLERVMLTVERYVQRANLLLDVSRVNAGRLQLNIEKVDLAEVVRDVSSSFRVEADFHQVAFNTHLPEVLVGYWDRVAVEQIATNLISNAVKYGAGAPVDVWLGPDGSETVRLTVKDRGIGISADDQARIFGRFEQVVTGVSRSGFGLGLWLVRSLVEAHGGTITVESELNKGSTFEVRLPLRATPSG